MKRDGRRASGGSEGHFGRERGSGSSPQPAARVPRALQRTFVIGSDKAQDVFVPQHHRLINFRLPKPGPFISGGEDFHSYIFPAPFSTPDFAKSAFSYNFLQDNSPCDCSLYKQR